MIMYSIHDDFGRALQFEVLLFCNTSPVHNSHSWIISDVEHLHRLLFSMLVCLLFLKALKF